MPLFLQYFSNHRLRLIALLVPALLLFAAQCHSRQLPPNIIVFFADDAGYSDFGFQGSTTHQTPSIDRIARSGTIFTQAYASSSVCSPSRAGLLTGRLQNRFGIEFNVPNSTGNPKYAEAGLPHAEITVAEFLQKNGYETALIGKWHLGSAPEFSPDKHGFKYYFGFLGGSSGYLPGKARQIVSNYTEIDYKNLPYITDAFGDEAVKFITSHQNKPFFLYMPFNAPHTPMQAQPDTLEKYLAELGNRRKATNAALVESMDANIGKVMDTIERLELMDNTLVMFTNDNGGHEEDNGASNYPLNGVKGMVLEGGIRVPMIASYPGRFPAGESYDSPVSLLDIFPTIAKAVGRDLPGDRDYDGIDLQSLFQHDGDNAGRDTFYWKVNWASALRHKNWKLIKTPGNTHYLFDLDLDPGETRNLLQGNPAISDMLISKLERWENSIPEPAWTVDLKWRARVIGLYQNFIN